MECDDGRTWTVVPHCCNAMILFFFAISLHFQTQRNFTSLKLLRQLRRLSLFSPWGRHSSSAGCVLQADAWWTHLLQAVQRSVNDVAVELITLSVDSSSVALVVTSFLHDDDDDAVDCGGGRVRTEEREIMGFFMPSVNRQAAWATVAHRSTHPLSRISSRWVKERLLRSNLNFTFFYCMTSPHYW